MKGLLSVLAGVVACVAAESMVTSTCLRCEPLPDDCIISRPIHSTNECPECQTCVKFAEPDFVCLGCPGCPGCPLVIQPCPMPLCVEPECPNPANRRTKHNCPACPFCPGDPRANCLDQDELNCPVPVQCDIAVPTTLKTGCPGCDLCCIDPTRDPMCSCPSGRYSNEPETCPTCEDCIREPCTPLACPEIGCLGTWVEIVGPDGCPRKCPICVPYKK